MGRARLRGDRHAALVWQALASTLAGEEDQAARQLAEAAPLDDRFLEAFRRFGPAGLVADPDALDRVLDRLR